jgi:hypothetical protein
MINEPRTYRRPLFQLILSIVLLGIFGISFFVSIPQIDNALLIPFVFFMVMVFLTVIYLITQKTIISEEGISTQTFLGENSLRWSEISRVSGKGYRIRLHNFDGDVTVTLNSQLQGYEEVVEWIGIKRPDLFTPQEYGEMSHGASILTMLTILILILAGTLIASGFLFLDRGLETVFPVVVVTFIILAVFFVLFFLQPRSVTLDGKSLVIKYLFKETTLLADEIASINLRYTQSRNGKNYYVLVTRKDKKTVRISGLSPSLPIIYLVLKNWHAKNSKLV